MTERHVEIYVPPRPGQPGRGEILVNGEKLRGVTGFTVTHDSRSMPKLTGERPLLPNVTVDLLVVPFIFEGRAELHVSDRAHEQLIEFGWTPPPE